MAAGHGQACISQVLFGAKLCKVVRSS